MKIIYYIILLAGCFSFGHSNVTEIIFAGNKTYTECKNGYQMSPLDITVADYIKQQGYPVEEHAVISAEGYLLSMQRIPGESNSRPIFLQHGVLTSSLDYVFSGKNRSLAFFLADNGYDVWLGNIRGSPYSRCNKNYTTHDYQFWNYSFDQLGQYDLTAQVSYVIEKTNKDIIYVGHSLGTTMFYVMMDAQPNLIKKIKLAVLFAPITTLYYTRSPVQYLVTIAPAAQLLSPYITSGEINYQLPVWKYFVDYFCGIALFTKKICTSVLFALYGAKEEEFDYDKTQFLLHHFPSSTSFEVLNHYAQGILTNEFRHFHYGTSRNLIAYNSTLPPFYNISKVRVPTGIVWSDNDYLTDHRDIGHYISNLPCSELIFNIRLDDFGHLDYLWGKNAREIIYNKILPYINKYK